MANVYKKSELVDYISDFEKAFYDETKQKIFKSVQTKIKEFEESLYCGCCDQQLEMYDFELLPYQSLFEEKLEENIFTREVTSKYVLEVPKIRVSSRCFNKNCIHFLQKQVIII